jgi:hypothetical protein
MNYDYDNDYSENYRDITADLAIKLSEEDALYGRKLASAECSRQHEGEFGLGDYYLTNPESFLTALRCLPDEPAELIARYWLLGWSQEKIGHYLGVPQSKMSKRIRDASRALAATIAFGGPPSLTVISEVLRPLGREFQIVRAAGGKKTKPMALPLVLSEYGQLHSYTAVAEKHGLDRIAVRRHIRSTAELLDQSTDRQAVMVGAWLLLLVRRSSTEGTGYRKRRNATAPAA